MIAVFGDHVVGGVVEDARRRGPLPQPPGGQVPRAGGLHRHDRHRDRLRHGQGDAATGGASPLLGEVAAVDVEGAGSAGGQRPLDGAPGINDPARSHGGVDEVLEVLAQGVGDGPLGRRLRLAGREHRHHGLVARRLARREQVFRAQPHQRLEQIRREAPVPAPRLAGGFLPSRDDAGGIAGLVAEDLLDLLLSPRPPDRFVLVPGSGRRLARDASVGVGGPWQRDRERHRESGGAREGQDAVLHSFLLWRLVRGLKMFRSYAAGVTAALAGALGPPPACKILRRAGPVRLRRAGAQPRLESRARATSRSGVSRPSVNEE